MTGHLLVPGVLASADLDRLLGASLAALSQSLPKCVPPKPQGHAPIRVAVSCFVRARSRTNGGTWVTGIPGALLTTLVHGLQIRRLGCL